MLFEDELNRLRIPLRLINCAQCSHEPSVDAMCLHLLELLAERDALPKSGPGHIEQRRTAISDTMVNYLLLTILESFPLNHAIFIPGSLVHLIRRQLCGEYPDLYETYETRNKLAQAAIIAADVLDIGGQLTVRRTAKLLKIPRSTAARWLASKVFQDFFNEERESRMKYAASPKPASSPEGLKKLSPHGP
jgi:hypothetical protein